jgi:hypothetical protein
MTPSLYSSGKTGTGRLNNMVKATQQVKSTLCNTNKLFPNIIFTLKEATFTISDAIQKNRSYASGGIYLFIIFTCISISLQK